MTKYNEYVIKELFDIGITFKANLVEWTNDHWKNQFTGGNICHYGMSAYDI